MTHPHRLTVALCLVVAGCLDKHAGSAAQPDADASADTVAEAETAAPDSSAPDIMIEPDIAVTPDTGAPTSLVPPAGPWRHETIGDCIHVLETLTWSDAGDAVTWRYDDENYCSDGDPDVTRKGSVAMPSSHVVTIELPTDGWMPRRVTWTWAILPGAPERLHTAAFQRVPGTDRWHREDRELRGTGGEVSDRQLIADVTLVGYPDVRRMDVDFDVSWSFGDQPYEPRGARGHLSFPATRVVDSAGRTAIAAEGYDPDDYLDRYRFQQELLTRFDGNTVDLIADAFFPILIEVEGDPGSLVMQRSDREWERVPSP